MAYQVLVDTQRTGAFDGPYDDITAYVVSANWRAGMSSSYDDVAQPARADIVLNNVNGEFSQDSVGVELLTNGSFTAWTGSTPNGWTVDTTLGTVGQVGLGEGTGGSGTGAANLSGQPVMSQTVVYTGRVRFTILIDPLSVGALAVRLLPSVGTGYSFAFKTAGYKTFDWYIAGTTTVSINSGNYGAGTPDVTIDNVSLKSIGKYDGALARGTLIRILEGSTQLYEGKIAHVTPPVGSHSTRQTRITVEDAMLQLLDASYIPGLLTNATIDQGFDEIFDKAVMPYPYAHTYWMLGVEGASELDLTATLYTHTATDFDTASTTLDWLGDNQDLGRGTSVQGVIRDLMASEFGGRFFFQPRTGKFVFHSRHRDALNITVAATYDVTAFSGTDPGYGDDLVNWAIVNYEPREVGAANTVLWSETNLPIEMEPGETKRLKIRFRDPDDDQAQVGASEVATPIAGVDYIANSEEDGTGTNNTNYLVMTVEAGGGGAVVAITNSMRRKLYVLTLQVRGTPIIRYPSESVEHQDGDSIRRHEKAQQTYHAPAISDKEYAQGAAEWMVSRFHQPLTRLKSVTQVHSGGDAALAAALAHTIGDRITITDTGWTGFQRDHFIVGEQHSLIAGGNGLHTITWVLKPAYREAYWLLGTAGRGELGVTTVLAW